LPFSSKYDIFILTGGDMENALQGYMDYTYLLDQVKDYQSPRAKITTMIKSGEIIRVKRGLYVPGQGKSYSLRTLANRIYGPSYISFEYALSYHNLIPERVATITSASLAKNKRKEFKTPVGTFVYHSVAPAVYPYGVTRMEENANPFLIATREKALCDTLSKLKGHAGRGSLEELLYEDLRMEEEDLLSMELSDLEFLVPMYRKSLLTELLAYLKLNTVPVRRKKSSE
jgi:predicted transcriptional regulator of viral defense system